MSQDVAKAGPGAANTASVASVGPPAAPGEEAMPLPSDQPVTTLVEAIARALAYNPTLATERSTTRATKYRIPQAKSQFGPQLDYRLTYGFRRDKVDQLFLPNLNRSGWTHTMVVTLTQPLVTFGRLESNLRQAKAQVDYQNEVFDSVEQQVLYSAIDAYISVLRDRTGLQLARDNVDLLTKEFDSSKERKSVREITSVDLDQVESRLGLAKSDLASAEIALARSEAKFVSVVGAPAGDLTPPNPVRMPVQSLDSAYAYAGTGSPVLAAAQARERSSRAAADAARAALRPRIDLEGQLGQNPVSPYRDDLRQTGVSGLVVLSGPLFDSGYREARTHEYDELHEADVHRVDQVRRDVVSQVRGAWQEWKSREDAVGDLEPAAQAAQAAYDGASQQQRAGMRTTLDILILARELNTVRITLNQTSAAAYLAKAQTLLAMGALDPADFGQARPEQYGPN
ncbi:TolC family protein [Tsuneonella mangrovi]|uniref:TolC family protein n=1 Tax=Tsuneonella mangrovi TaxID=1982042 RepID=UPI0014717C31|nr:TolC family protein [Tsuneonella mangrovi]